MAQKSKRKKYKRDVDEPVFESDEYFAYIPGYTDGGFPYGITWEEEREIEKSDPQFGKPVGLTNCEEMCSDDVDLPSEFAHSMNLHLFGIMRLPNKWKFSL